MASAPTHAPRPVSAAPGRTRADRQARLGWLLIGLITAAVLLSWAPAVTGGFGNNHEGRTLGRQALHVANAHEHGLAGSGWLSDWSPYGGDDDDGAAYSHHPPVMNLVYYGVSRVLPFELETTLRLVVYTLAAAMLPVGAGLLRRLGVGWPAVVLATAAFVVTPLFWVYGRLHGSVTLLLCMVWALARLRDEPDPGPGRIAVTAAVSALAVTTSYLGLATAALFGLWLLARRGLDRATVVVGATMAAAAAVVAAYVLGLTGPAAVGDRIEMRTAGGEFTAAEFLQRLRRWFTELLPGWWRWALAPVAALAALADRRVRWPALLLGLVAVAYVFGLPNGAFIHDYWIFPFALPVWLGSAALVDRLLAGRRTASRADGTPPRTWAAVIAASVAVLGLGGGALVAADVPDAYVREPQRAGTLLRDTPPAPTQEVAWRSTGFPAARWVSYHWDLPTTEITALDEATGGDDARVLLREDRLPDALPDPDVVRAAAVAADGPYLVVELGVLRGLAAEHGG